MKKVFSAILVFVFLCALVAVWTLKDFNQKLCSEITARVSEKTGRSVVIDGEIKAHFSLSPSVRINDIKLTNAPWAEEAYMAQIGSLELQIKLLPLFHRKAEVTHLDLKDVQLDFEVDSKGQKNWIFPLNNADSSAEKKASETEKKSYSFIADNITFENVRLLFKDRQKEKTTEAQIKALALNLTQNGLSIDSQWAAGQETFTVKLDAKNQKGQSFEQTAYDFLMHVSGTGITARIEGRATDPLSDRQIKADIDLQMAQASLLNEELGISVPALSNVSVTARIDDGPDGLSVPSFKITAGTTETISVEAEGTADSFSPLSVRFQARIDAPNMQAVQGLPALPATKAAGYVELEDGSLSLNNIQLAIGASDLSGRIVFRTEPNVFIQTQLHSRQLHLADFFGKNYSSFGRKKAAALPASNLNNSGKVFSSDPLPFETLSAAEIDVDYAIDSLTAANGQTLGKVNLRAAMHEGVFDLPALNLADYALLQGRFDTSKRPAEIKAGLKMNKLPLSLFLAQNNVERGTADGMIQLGGQGNSESEIAASLNGRIFVDLQDVYVSSYQLISLPEALSFLSPFDDRQPLSIPCAVVNVPVKNGVISSQNKIGMESSMLNMQINGKINLADENVQMKIDVEPSSQGMLKAVFNSASVDGTLADPVVKLNTDKAIDNALYIGMAFLTGGRQAAQEYMNQKKLQHVCQEALTAAAQ